MSEAIFVEGLTKTYAEKIAVDHLDLSVKSDNSMPQHLIYPNLSVQ